MSTFTHSKYNPGLDKIVERQLRNWERGQQIAQAQPRRHGRPVQDFIAISRAVGLSGENVGAVLAERLGWPMFDKEILQLMAGDNRCRSRLYESMDERDIGWLESVLQTIGGDSVRDDYFHQLRASILTIARKGHAIFLGRAADLILPANTGLRVRLEAGRKYCVHAFAEEHHLSEHEAARKIDEIEHDRAGFFRHHFNIDSSSPMRHDLILNMERLAPEQVTDIILSAVKIRCTNAEDATLCTEDANTGADFRFVHDPG